MHVNGFGPVFGIACAGGAVLEFYKWYQLREAANWPAYARSFKYWILTVGMVLVGGFLAVLYGTGQQLATMVFNIGLSAPAVIRAAGSNVPTGRRRGAAGAGGPSIRDFLGGR